MKKAYKIMSAMMVVIMIAMAVSPVFANVTIDGISKAGKTDTNADNAMQNLGGTIVKYITNAAMVVAVVMIAVLGIKYMIGSAEEKSEYKKSLVPLLIGAILVFGAAVIAKIIVGLAESFTGK